MKVRARFVCEAVKKRKHWTKPGEFLYEAEFNAVHDGSPENEEFFEATPSGQIRMATLKADHFEPGRTYAVEFEPIEETA